MAVNDLEQHLALGRGRIGNVTEHCDSSILDVEAHLIAQK